MRKAARATGRPRSLQLARPGCGSASASRAGRSRLGLDPAALQRPPGQRLGPLGPLAAMGVDGHRLETRPAPCRSPAGRTPPPAVAPVTSSSATRPARAVLEVGQESLDQRVPGGVEVDRLVLDRLLAPEGAQEARACRDPGQAVRPGPCGRTRSSGARRPRCSSTWMSRWSQAPSTTSSVSSSRSGGIAGEDRVGHLRAVRVAVQLVVGRLADPVLRRPRLLDDLREARGSSRRVARRTAPAPRSPPPRRPARAPARPAARGTGPATRTAGDHRRPEPAGGRK